MSFDPEIPEQLFEWVLEEVSEGHETPEVHAAVKKLKGAFARVKALEKENVGLLQVNATLCVECEEARDAYRAAKDLLRNALAQEETPVAEIHMVSPGDKIVCLASSGNYRTDLPRIEGAHACDKDARVKALEEENEQRRVRIVTLELQLQQALVDVGQGESERRGLLDCLARSQEAARALAGEGGKDV